jgi:hypothetical protein
VALKELGIERCEGCEDSLSPGEVFKMDLAHKGEYETCPDCNDEGWVMK